MKVRADFAETVYVTPETWRWQPSPESGVERVMLDRVGEEVAVEIGRASCRERV